MYRLKRRSHNKMKIVSFLLVILLLIVGGYLYLSRKSLIKPTVLKNSFLLNFDNSVTESERDQITKSLKEQNINLKNVISVSVSTKDSVENINSVISANVFTTGLYSSIQNLDNSVLTDQKVEVNQAVDNSLLPELAKFLNIKEENLSSKNTDYNPSSSSISIEPVSSLNAKQKLLSYNQNYYLDNFTKGAIFRVVEFSGEGSDKLKNINFSELPNKENIYKVNMSGVTALTRMMGRKLNQVNDPLYFSKYIGPFLADADLTHISNEVSFQPNCQYNDAVFCSDPRFIEIIKASGVDLIELTGNHNNDVGRQYNTDSINLYHSLDIKTFGGGLNAQEAQKAYFADFKGSKVTFLAYNYADSPSGLAIATGSEAGANSFDFNKIEADIKQTKAKNSFVIVDVQYNECYSYPDGFVEFPICNLPIANQKETFRKIIDLGADMVIGSSAHQPQIYESYKDKMIYYGLGNLYFDQTQWPGTERGIILTHYFKDSKLVQTKLTPTIYDEALQTKQMTPEKVKDFLDFLNKSR